MLERDPEGAIRDHIDRILLIDRNYPQALDLKAKAEDRIQQLKLAAATPASTIPAPASTIPSPAGAPSGVPSAAATSAPAAPAPASTIPAPAARSTATTIPPATSAPAAGRAASTVSSPRMPGPIVPPDPTMVARRPKETETAWRARSKAVQTQYQDTRAALDRGDFAGAVSGFEAILRDAPGYQDSEALLGKAHEGQQAAGRQAAQQAARQAFEAAIAADVAGNWAGAIQQFERARQLDSSLGPQADDGMRRVRDKMRAAGNEAFKRARQYDALGRTTEAIAQYTEAASLLPPDDPNAKVAKDRLDALRGGK
jgi:tetratricopeptide (TPR) repeat protein